MRSIKELLQLMLDNEHLFKTGLCGWAYFLMWHDTITVSENAKLNDYIYNNRPSPTSSINALIHMKNRYYWNKGNIKPRVKWLKKHIAKNTDSSDKYAQLECIFP